MHSYHKVLSSFKTREIVQDLKLLEVNSGDNMFGYLVDTAQLYPCVAYWHHERENGMLR